MNKMWRLTIQKEVKKVSFVIALFLCLVLVACQSTPNKPVIIGKNYKSATNAIEYNEADYPRTYKDSYTDNGAEISFDATLCVPRVKVLPIYQISPVAFSQDKIETIIQGLFGDKQLYALGQLTKSDLEPAYIQALSDLKEKEANPENFESSIEYYQEQLDNIKHQIESAPAEDILNPIDHTLKKSKESIEYYNARGDLGKDQMAVLRIINANNDPILGDNSSLEFINGNKYDNFSTYYPDLEDVGPSNLLISKEDAISKAEDIVHRLGADYMQYSSCNTGIYCGSDAHYPESFDPNISQAYLVYFTRCIEGASVTYDIRNYSSNIEDSVSPSVMYERIMVAVDDSGIAYISWLRPICIEDTLNENIKILPFDDMLNIANKQFSYTYATYDNLEQLNKSNNQPKPLVTENTGKTISNEVHIQKITLGYMQIPDNSNEKASELVPVWDFFGYLKSNYEDKTNKIYFKNDQSLLTINAINGNIIDRNLGY